MVTSVAHDSETIMKRLSQNIYILRIAKGWSQDKLAKKVGVSRATINRIEQGHRMPDFDLACKIADALDTDTDQLRKNLKEVAASA